MLRVRSLYIPDLYNTKSTNLHSQPVDRIRGFAEVGEEVPPHLYQQYLQTTHQLTQISTKLNFTTLLSVLFKYDHLPEAGELSSRIWSFRHSEGVLKMGLTVHCLSCLVDSIGASSDEGELIGASK